MALSGSFSGSIAGGKYALRVDWSATQSIANNTSKITCTLYLVQASSWSLNINTRTDNTAVINGTTYTWASPSINNGGGRTTKLATVTSGNIEHNADGSKSVTLTALFNIRATISGTYYSAIRASATVKLNDIPRATQPTLSASSADMGSTVTVSLPRAASSLTHELSFLWEGAGLQFIASGVGTSYSWKVPDLASSIPNKTSGKITLEVTTYSGSKAVGTKRAYLTARVPASVVPTVNAPTLVEKTDGIAAKIGAYVQGKSTLGVTINAAGARGSTIVAYQATFMGKTYATRSFTSPVLSQSGALTLSIKVKDSRGRWSASRVTTVNVLPYSAPRVPSFRVYRVDSSGAADEEGVYLAVSYKYDITPLNNKNDASAIIEYRQSAATTWTQLQALTGYRADTTDKPATPTFSVDYQYNFRLTVSDYFGSRSYEAILPSAKVIMDILASGAGISFGKTADAPGVDFGWPIIGREQTMGSMVGQWQLPGGPLIQWGTASVTPSAANAVTVQTVTFPVAYTSTPVVFLTPVTSVPQKVAVGLTGRTSASFDIDLLRTDGTTTTSVNWLAIGPRT